ncbi:DNA-binding response regulator, OmpR family, contains REC and winged-helix (wHTH) domain [Pseudomonas sp. NFACC23-1]|uniref:response regulator transcription factor n=1 Tax=unclassified Pseudomonas TaxID=196821 RepID=UPI00088503B0|nr:MULTISPECIES: DNA-binding response regulator [unclassified Pseudomonas]SDB52377.1 DNA-binding response regulator, OmpR family, contains REC and winged-helix (wHTH) domain [Pseudomonas sp. NFACC17-2]SEJ72131.1 DNA-binding response regulator, OmpR family, contains REC and winged-helix (wHTH) domain [Pseudomonas sp. NFACC23-1]SFW84615.1 DNA-binding response regulator, OmpR family, contains REC and winged-helix (wHTH) domain [Pseudomonas sp. NFACC16-2]
MDNGRYERQVLTAAGAAASEPLPHILLIDDVPEDIRATLILLKTQPWRISLASDAYQGYQRALALRPDLIVLDVHMPQMDGFSLCRLLREAPATRHTPILFLSSANTSLERLEGLTVGAVDYIPKSCAPEEVLARIRIHLQLTWRAPPAIADNPADPQPQGDEIVLRAAMRLIENQLDNIPSLGMLAQKVGTHEKRLSAIFREHLGMTVFAYIRDARLRRGQELLCESAMSVQDVAEVVGFRNACNFTTAFRQRIGMTPSQFRQQTLGFVDAESVGRA